MCTAADSTMKGVTAFLGVIVATVRGQDRTPCTTYDMNTGSGVCNGVTIAVGNVICANQFDANKCNASWTNGGSTETYYFKGTPTGLPVGTSIQSDCSTTEFPASGGVAMALVYTQAAGEPAGCYAVADVHGTTLTYTAQPDGTGVASVTINFNVHSDSGGSQRVGFIKVTCVSGGPTDNFGYTTLGDTGHVNIYEVDTTADCTAAGPHPPTATPTATPTVPTTSPPPTTPQAVHTSCAGVSQGTLAGASIGCIFAGIVIGAAMVLVATRRGSLQITQQAPTEFDDFEPMLKIPPANSDDDSHVLEDA
eukprot:m.171838 g.171838  ORF g.171838 m.171838 type:complete len:308 (+) comp14822_c0_seq1:483-1406(+)